MTVAKGIMFLSIADFTDKGIQVVKLTPEYFARQGWRVHYVVSRDGSPSGSYRYQPVIAPEGVVVHRTNTPSLKIGERLTNHLLTVIYSQLRDYAATIKLVWIGYSVLRKNEIDVLYGGGPHGSLAVRILELLQPGRKYVTVSRFYGIWDLYSEVIVRRKWLRLISNAAAYAALYLPSSLKIITNDGTHGDKALRHIRPSNVGASRFYVNGVDKHLTDRAELAQLRASLHLNTGLTAACITRLVPSKRLDLCIRVTAEVVNQHGVHDFALIVVGDGSERNRLEKLVDDLSIRDHVIFVGAVDNHSVKNYLAIADLFLSMYRVSNVGNPLLEAIRANKVILTLDNGDTSSWIRHRQNGFIYDDNDSAVGRMAKDIAYLARTPSLLDQAKANLSVTAQEKLWTWNERLQAEFSDVNSLVEST